MKELVRWGKSFSRKHRRLLLRDTLISLAIGVGVGSSVLFVYANFEDRVALATITFMVTFFLIVGTDHRIEELLKEEKDARVRKNSDISRTA